MTTDTKNDPATFNMTAPITKSVGGTGNKPTIIASASSDQVDRGGDKFTLSALNAMAAAFPGKTLWISHRYNPPEDVGGKITAAKVVQRGGMNVLDIEAELDEHNPRAIAIFDQIQSGIQLALSVGVIVRRSELVKDPATGQKVMQISEVEPLEISCVGIGANRESLVREALMKSAAYAARSQIALTDENNVDASELTAAKAVVRLLMAGIAEKDSEVEEMRALVAGLMAEVNKIMDLPQPRKTDPSISSGLDTLAEKHGYLTPEVRAMIARSQA